MHTVFANLKSQQSRSMGYVLPIIVSLMAGCQEAPSKGVVEQKLVPAVTHVSQKLPLTAEEVKSIVTRRFVEARPSASRQLDQHLKFIDDFFGERKKRTRIFADSVLSMSSKFSLVWNAAPWGTTNAHSDFVRAQFKKQILDEAEIMRLIATIVSGYDKSLEGIESELLVKLQADLADDLPKLQLDLIRPSAIQHWIRESLGQTDNAVTDKVVKEVWAEVAAFALGNVAEGIVAELLVSAGILGAGGASALETLGIGLAAAVAIDMTYSAIADPKGKLAATIDAKLDGLANRIISGDQHATGLRSVLENHARQRELTRRDAIVHLLTSELTRKQGATP